MVKKSGFLKIKGFDKLIGKMAHWLWLIGEVDWDKHHYVIRVWRGSEQRTIYIERVKWGDGYRMWSMNRGGVGEEEIHFWEGDIQTPDGLTNVTSELIDRIYGTNN